MSTITLVIFVLLNIHEFASAEQCIPGMYHKNASSAAGTEYAQCEAWSDNTCCTAQFTAKLNATRMRDLYKFHWGHCKDISWACEKYLLAEECFYSCEPSLIKWHTGNAYIKKVPVCGDFCDDWYKACENDQTCVEDWLNGFNMSGNAYSCPKNSTCRTFKQMYGSGKNLCNKMWGDTFVYMDASNCPCARLDRPVPTNVENTSTCSRGSSDVPPLPLFLVLLVFYLMMLRYNLN